ncbi:hypothetical protein DCAR_0831453 [Daucus carota subsp. sativus]|uniref:DUF641 domain-containing protein n=2 Tax=Daucus carota subsp. sativus TaxID=79200 RepID=A0AAF0XRI4_DAUCS|nr:PREDICTED: IRK-interacting protein [Daucus carota subsp. sativus]WOH11957.1 hypothetical protein DCAR_0831453 [Daucus carota subsp. sativus]
MEASNKPTAITKFTKTVYEAINFKSAKKNLSNNSFCLIIPQKKRGDCDESESRKRAAMQAFVSKLFATISTIKASYAELQMAQFSNHNIEAIQSADQVVVDELRTLSEVKNSFLKKQIKSSPPHVTFLLTEIQEQHSHMKMYEITIKNLEAQIEVKKEELSALQENLRETTLINKAHAQRLNSGGRFSILDNIVLSSSSNPRDFILVLQYAMKSVREFINILVNRMEIAKWDIDIAVNAIQPNFQFSNRTQKWFAFESFVCQEMFKNFDTPGFSLQNGQCIPYYIDQFTKLKSANATHFFNQYPNSSFGKFTRSKYLQLIHPKMEASFYGNLNQRKLVNSWGCPETTFFAVFAEMARRVWILHCLAFTYNQEVSVFEVKKNCMFSEMYMVSVTSEVFLAGNDEVTVGFMVVPGFKIGKMVVQSKIYLAAAKI